MNVRLIKLAVSNIAKRKDINNSAQFIYSEIEKANTEIARLRENLLYIRDQINSVEPGEVISIEITHEAAEQILAIAK